MQYSTKVYKKLSLIHIFQFYKLKFEKVNVGGKESSPLISNEELEQKGQVPVVFEGLHTWESLYNGRLSVKAEANTIKITVMN